MVPILGKQNFLRNSSELELMSHWPKLLYAQFLLQQSQKNIVLSVGLSTSPNQTQVLLVNKRRTHTGEATIVCILMRQILLSISFFSGWRTFARLLSYWRCHYLKDLVRILYCCPLRMSIFNLSTHNFEIFLSSGCEPQLVHLQPQCPPGSSWGQSAPCLNTFWCYREKSLAPKVML